MTSAGKPHIHLFVLLPKVPKTPHDLPFHPSPNFIMLRSPLPQGYHGLRRLALSNGVPNGIIVMKVFKVVPATILFPGTP